MKLKLQGYDLDKFSGLDPVGMELNAKFDGKYIKQVA